MSVKQMCMSHAIPYWYAILDGGDAVRRFVARASQLVPATRRIKAMRDIFLHNVRRWCRYVRVLS